MDQLTAVKTRYPLTSITWPYLGLSCRPIEVELNCDYAGKSLKISCVRCNSVKFDIHFLGLRWEVFFGVTTDDLLHIQPFKNVRKKDFCPLKIKITQYPGGFRLNTSDNTDTETIPPVRFRLYGLFSCDASGYAISRQNNLALHLGCHTCWLSYLTLVCLRCGVYGHVITKFSGKGRFTYPWCSTC